MAGAGARALAQRRPGLRAHAERRAREPVRGAGGAGRRGRRAQVRHRAAAHHDPQDAAAGVRARARLSRAGRLRVWRGILKCEEGRAASAVGTCNRIPNTECVHASRGPAPRSCHAGQPHVKRASAGAQGARRGPELPAAHALGRHAHAAPAAPAPRRGAPLGAQQRRATRWRARRRDALGAAAQPARRGAQVRRRAPARLTGPAGARGMPLSVAHVGHASCEVLPRAVG